MSLPDHQEMVRIVQEWNNDPSKMLRWRTEEYKYLLLLLDHKIRNPGSTARAETAQYKAISLLNQMLAAMDTIRDEVPTVCPECGHKFVPGGE